MMNARHRNIQTICDMVCLRRLANELAERRLADSPLMRRAAQLTLYQWQRLSEAATKISKLGHKQLSVTPPL